MSVGLTDMSGGSCRVEIVGKPDALIISEFIVYDMTRVGMFPTESSGAPLTSRPPIWGLYVICMIDAFWTLRGIWRPNRVRCSHDAGTMERFTRRLHLSTGRWAALRAEPDCSDESVQLPQRSEPRSHSLYGTRLRHLMRLFHLAGLA